jgi:ZIP family zinc transporter
MLITWFANLNPVWQALLATCFTWLVTAMRASGIYVFKDLNRRVLDGLFGFAAGVMIYVVAEELFPESKLEENTHIASGGAMLGLRS